MSTHPEYQNQHRVPRTYLKNFGYNSNGQWWVSIYEIGQHHTDNMLIGDFSAEYNIFDAPFGDITLRRNFELQCSKIENYYPTVISNLHNQKQLTAKNVEVLWHFISTLLTRSKPVEDFIKLILNEPRAYRRFIDEITMFSENKDMIQKALQLTPSHQQYNTILGNITQHFVQVLSNFDFIILKSIEDISWMTSDNPIMHDKKQNFEWLISPDSEIYLPLSKDFCLFAFHKNSSDKSNELRNLRLNKVNKITDSLFFNIQERIGQNCYKYLILPIELENTNL